MRLNPKYLVPRAARDKVRLAFTYKMYDVGFPMVYQREAQEPVAQNKAVFIEIDRDVISDSMKLVYDEMQHRGFTCEFISLHLNCGKITEYTKRSLRMAKMVATAHFVFICEACQPLACLPLRKETKVVQLWHGCGAFKKFGMSTADKIFGGTREEKMRYPAHRNTSLVTVSSPEVVWAYEEAMCLEGQGIVRPLGISRTDVFFDQDFVDGQRSEVEAAVPQAKDKKVLLYAPTFRGRVAQAEAPDQLDIALLNERLGNEWILFIKHHPHVKKRPPIPEGCDSFAFDVTDALSIEACLCRADACVSDYSSLVYEYSLFRRPMAFFAYDKDDYDDWRGFYYDYDELTPGPVFTVTEEIADWADGLANGFDPAEVDAFRRRFMSACDGHATERIVDEALGLHGEAEDDKTSPFDMTVIIPVYNAEPYLSRCIASLDAQSMSQEHFEVILINDGSTDNSLELCHEAARLRHNYVIVNQENKGVSAARNAGIGIARGRYLMFLDPDDEVSTSTVSALVSAFDSHGKQVDLFTYPLCYHDVDTGREHRNIRQKWLEITGVYYLDEFPFIAQSTINVCVKRCVAKETLFDEFRIIYEDQVFNTTILSRKCAIGYCADAEYKYYRSSRNTSSLKDKPELTFGDVMSAFELFEKLALDSPRLARYAYSLILYNVGWRFREGKLFPNYGDNIERSRNYDRLSAVLSRIPIESWKESPYLSDTLRVFLMNEYEITSGSPIIHYSDNATLMSFPDGFKLSCSVPSVVIDCALKRAEDVLIKGYIYGPSFIYEDAPTLKVRVDSLEKELKVAPSSCGDEGSGTCITKAWRFELILPPMKGKPYDVVFLPSFERRAIPSVNLSFNLKHCNGRYVYARVREFGYWRISLDGNRIHIGTIKDLPLWTMPVVSVIAKCRDLIRLSNNGISSQRIGIIQLSNKDR